MGKVRRRFEEPLKREAVRFLEETGRPLREVAVELKVSEGALWRWRKQYGTAPEVLSPSEAAELRRLRREVEILRRQHEGAFTVVLMCRVLAVARAGYYAWRRRAPSARAQLDTHLRVTIRAIHAASPGAMGGPGFSRRCGRRGSAVGRSGSRG